MNLTRANPAGSSPEKSDTTGCFAGKNYASIRGKIGYSVVCVCQCRCPIEGFRYGSHYNAVDRIGFRRRRRYGRQDARARLVFNGFRPIGAVAAIATSLRAHRASLRATDAHSGPFKRHLRSASTDTVRSISSAPRTPVIVPNSFARLHHSTRH